MPGSKSKSKSKFYLRKGYIRADGRMVKSALIRKPKRKSGSKSKSKKARKAGSKSKSLHYRRKSYVRADGVKVKGALVKKPKRSGSKSKSKKAKKSGSKALHYRRKSYVRADGKRVKSALVKKPKRSGSKSKSKKAKKSKSHKKSKKRSMKKNRDYAGPCLETQIRRKAYSYKTKSGKRVHVGSKCVTGKRGSKRKPMSNVIAVPDPVGGGYHIVHTKGRSKGGIPEPYRYSRATQSLINQLE